MLAGDVMRWEAADGMRKYGVREQGRWATEGLINVKGERQSWHLEVNKS